MIFKSLFLFAYHLFRKDLHKLEYDPRTQYNFHRLMGFFWIVMGVSALWWPMFHNQSAALAIFEISIYANFDTDFGSMSSAMAAMEPNVNKENE